MIKAIIFDMDGVLVDTEPIHFLTYRQVLREYSIELSRTEFYRHWTRDGKGIKAFVEERKIDVDIDQIRAKKSRLYHSSLRASPPEMPRVIKTLKELIEYPLALATSSYRESTELILDLTEMREYFKAVVTCEDVKNVKPSPDCFLLAAQRLKVQPKDCLVIEDSEKGIRAALAANMKCIAIPDESPVIQNLWGADLYLTHIGQVTPELIKSF